MRWKHETVLEEKGRTNGFTERIGAALTVLSTVVTSDYCAADRTHLNSQCAPFIASGLFSSGLSLAACCINMYPHLSHCPLFHSLHTPPSPQSLHAKSPPHPSISPVCCSSPLHPAHQVIQKPLRHKNTNSTNRIQSFQSSVPSVRRAGKAPREKKTKENLHKTFKRQTLIAPEPVQTMQSSQARHCLTSAAT